MRRLLILLLLNLFTVWLHGQSIQVLNASSGQPVDGVVLITDQYSTQTDSLGIANIENFDEGVRILFKHSSFLPYFATKERLLRQGKFTFLIEDPVSLDEIVVSVNRWKQSTSEIPHTIKTIQTDEIIQYNPQTTADLLGTEGGIFIQKSQMGGGSPMIRGFAANRVLIVVDGIRMNNAIYRSGNLHNVISVDANSLDNTEIIYGPGSVIYGSDALGGVMSFNTLKPKLSASRNPEITGKAFTRYSSANREKTLHGTLNIGSGKWATLINATFSEFDNLIMGKDGPDYYLRSEFVDNKRFSGTDFVEKNSDPLEQKFTGYNQLNVLAKIRYRPNEKVDFLISGHHSQTGDVPRYDRLIQYRNDVPRYGQWYYGPQKWSLISGQLQFTKPYVLFDMVNMLAGFQKYTESRHDRNFNSPELRSRTENLDIFSFNLDFGKMFDKKNELYYGIEGYVNWVGSAGVMKNLENNNIEEIGSRYPNNSTYESLAGYYSFKYLFSKKFIFQVGSRFTYTHMKGEFDTRYFELPVQNFNMHNSAFNGNLGMVWHPSENWQINIHSSTGFRSPNIDDVAKVFDSEPGNVVVPNPDLKPEYARSLELSVIRSYTSKSRIEVTGFYTWLKNAMVRRDFLLNGRDSVIYDGVLSKVSALINTESATIVGTSLSFEYLFNNVFRTRNDLTLTKGHDSENLPLRHVPPAFGSSHIIYENQKLFLDLYVKYSGMLKFDQLAPSEQNKPHLYLPDSNGLPHSPSWWTVNVKGSYQINRTISSTFGIENLLNKRYRPYSSGLIAPGTNFILSLLVRY